MSYIPLLLIDKKDLEGSEPAFSLALMAIKPNSKSEKVKRREWAINALWEHSSTSSEVVFKKTRITAITTETSHQSKDICDILDEFDIYYQKLFI